jgi:NodT family efflux transporter outer membrane factor (OMF) lipoprotein
MAGWQIRFLVALSGAFLLAGCAVGPDFHRPEAPKDAGYSPKPLPQTIAAVPVKGGEAQQFVDGADIPFAWWKAFGSSGLDALVDQAFRANPTIEAAKAALAQAQENVLAQEGYFFPTIQANYNYNQQGVAGNLSNSTAPGVQGNGRDIQPVQNATGSPHNKTLYYSFHTAQLTVSYVPDVFGGNRRQVESLDAQAQMQRFELEAAYLTLASNVVAAAVQEVSTREQIRAVNDIIDVNQKSLDLLHEQYKDGFAMRMDVASQEAALAQAKQLLPPLQKQLEQTRDLLRALVGNLPNQDIEPTFDLSKLKLPQQLPVSLPSRIIEQRPDVRAAEAQMHQASAQVGVAIANELPQFSIAGTGGGTATEFGQMFASGGPFESLLAGVGQTVFDGGTLLHERRAADQALIEAAAQYRSTVITAYQNVADTLHALISDGDALAAAEESDKAAKVTLDLTREQMQVGFVNYLMLLSAEQTWQQAELALVQAQAARFGDTAALFQALGGGWWNRTADPDTKLASAAAAQP